MKVLLHKNQLFYRDYRNSDNPPILHRKELFLHPEHPRFAEYSQLSLAEEAAGLLARSMIDRVERPLPAPSCPGNLRPRRNACSD